MEKPTGLLFLLAEALRYPASGHFEDLEKGAQRLPDSREKELFGSFLAEIRGLSLGSWEELHTRTLDLNPPAAPYIGFQTWGESYQRGTFLSKMNAELARADIDMDGELPDHLIPVLRYLAAVQEPLPELGEVIGPALQRITSVLRDADAHNPYLFLLEAAQGAVKLLRKEPV